MTEDTKKTLDNFRAKGIYYRDIIEVMNVYFDEVREQAIRMEAAYEKLSNTIGQLKQKPKDKINDALVEFEREKLFLGYLIGIEDDDYRDIEQGDYA